MHWKELAAIVIAANRSPELDANLNLNIPIEIPRVGDTSFLVKDLWNNKTKGIYTARQLGSFPLSIGRDKVAGGGIALLKIEVLGEHATQLSRSEPPH